MAHPLDRILHYQLDVIRRLIPCALDVVGLSDTSFVNRMKL